LDDGQSEVISSSVGLVLRNALVATDIPGCQLHGNYSHVLRSLI